MKNVSKDSNILERVHNLSEKINAIYSPLDKDLSDEKFLEIFGLVNEVLSILNQSEEFSQLAEMYSEMKVELINKRKRTEFNERKKKPTQTHQDMLIKVIENCISSCKTLNENNVIISKNDNPMKSSSKSSQNSSNDIIPIDFPRLQALFSELSRTDEVADILYDDIKEKINELRDINQRLDDELERV